MGNQIEDFRANVLPKYEKLVQNKLNIQEEELRKKQLRIDKGKACVMWHIQKGKLKERRI